MLACKANKVGIADQAALCRVSRYRGGDRSYSIAVSRYSAPLRPLASCREGAPPRTPKGAHSTKGRSRHFLETPFSEPLLRTLLRTLFYCKTHRRPPSQNPSENPSPEPFPEPSQSPSQNAVLPYAPLGVHPSRSTSLGTEHLKQTFLVGRVRCFLPTQRIPAPY